jgi:hypothetical protein
VEEIEGEVLLRVESLVMLLPADRELIVPLMREALEFNLMTTGSARFAIAGRRLLAAATRPADQVAPNEIEACLDEAGVTASLGAERFTRRFGGTTKTRQRAEDGTVAGRRRAGVSDEVRQSGTAKTRRRQPPPASPAAMRSSHDRTRTDES